MKQYARVMSVLYPRASDALGLLGILFVALVLYQGAPLLFPTSNTFSIAGTEIHIEIASTPEAHAKGLSGRTTLAEKSGMLFVFGEPRVRTFWMPNMNFALDIIWIGRDGAIVDISEWVTPESYPKTFAPRVPAQYVLEVPAGSVTKYNWKVGDLVHTPYIVIP